MTEKTLIDPGRSEPIFHQIKNLILSKITSGELKPHDQLPSEREYQVLSGASRQTVRRALDELVHQNILYRKPGKGTYVAEQASELPMIGVMGSITHLALSPDHRYRINSIEKKACPAFAARLLNLPESSSVVFIEQLALVRGEARFIHRSYLPFTIAEKLLHIKQVDLSVLEMMVLFCGMQPEISRDHLCPGVADSHDSHMLEIDDGALVQVQRGVIYAHDRKPLETHELVIRGDRFKQDIQFKLDARVIEQIVSRRDQTTTY